ncbi:NUDIX hydrolase N-terminal domain-containing protein [Paucisalibacillus sp. EB02]|uniref:NUDIX hydrolase n=1 Tax=Paucisalibacillus sp. EB02 TaxID=1347087 RepID=UPI0004BBE926|nr:NUDIX hydrolase [Paucisalibacillus sp. EB02]
MDTAERIKYWAREIKSLSQTGLAYGKDQFDQERYLKLNDLAVEMLSYISGQEKVTINQLLPIEQGYHTPKVAVRGLVIHNDKLLMVKEAADGLWCLPGGWCDIGLTASENIEKEIYEETGLKTKAVRLLALYDQTKKRPSITMQHIYNAYFLCEMVEGDSGELRGSKETEDVQFFSYSSLPPLSLERMSAEQLDMAMSVAFSDTNSAYFD